jgi:hypothetical protein
MQQHDAAVWCCLEVLYQALEVKANSVGVKVPEQQQQWRRQSEVGFASTTELRAAVLAVHLTLLAAPALFKLEHYLKHHTQSQHHLYYFLSTTWCPTPLAGCWLLLLLLLFLLLYHQRRHCCLPTA